MSWSSNSKYIKHTKLRQICFVLDVFYIRRVFNIYSMSCKIFACLLLSVITTTPIMSTTKGEQQGKVIVTPDIFQEVTRILNHYFRDSKTK